MTRRQMQRQADHARYHSDERADWCSVCRSSWHSMCSGSRRNGACGCGCREDS